MSFPMSLQPLLRQPYSRDTYRTLLSDILPSGTLHLLQTPQTILATLYFTPREQVALFNQLDLPLPKTQEITALRENASDFKTSQKKGRDSRFKSDIIFGYHFTCALTGYRLETDHTALVQACHSHQHAKSGNDDPRNGLALTPDAHWMFDKGLWTDLSTGDDLLIQDAEGPFTETYPPFILLHPS